MSTVIGGVTLTSDMYFSDEYKYKTVNASVEKTIGGGIVVQEFQAVEAGRLVTLESTDKQGFQTKAIVDSLMALASTPGYTYTLTITTSGSTTFTRTVRFRNEVDGGAVQFEPAHSAGGIRKSTDYFKGTIYLMVV